MRLGKLFKAGIGIVTLPVAVVKDVVTLGGTATGKGSYTKEQVEEIAEDLDKVTDET